LKPEGRSSRFYVSQCRLCIRNSGRANHDGHTSCVRRE
jgi:hypothetical protein